MEMNIDQSSSNVENEELLNILVDEIDDGHSSKRKKEAKRLRKRFKPVLYCVVCGDRAEGYNFDAISCESCKAFFRRNALRPAGKLKCRGQGNCQIAIETRKRCKKCRLEKCLRMGMRKEWILSEDEKRTKRVKIEENRRLRSTNKKFSNENNEIRSYFDKTANESMNETDWKRIHQVQTAYSEAIAMNKVIGVPLYPAVHRIETPLELIRIPTYLSSIRLITYLKKIPEFDLFDAEDRVTLVKHNLLAMVFIHSVLLYNPQSDYYHEDGTEDPIFKGEDWVSIIGESVYRNFTTIIQNLIEILQCDRIIVKFILLIVLFTKGFCAYDILHEPNLNRIEVVTKTHHDYIETLYRYSLEKYGAQATITMFSRLIGQLFSIQSLAIHFKNCVHTQIDASQLSPLMQTILQISDTDSTS